MRSVAILGGKGGTTKTASSHLICLGAFLHGIPAAYALTDPLRKVRGEGRLYAVLDGRMPEQLALILDSSRNNLNGWLVIDGGGNRPDFDIEVSKHVDLTIIPFRASEEDIDTVAQSLAAIPTALAWPSAWPTNSFAVNTAQYLLEALGKAFPQRIVSPPIPFVNWPELTKRPSDTHKETKQEHHAALRKAAGGVRSGLNPSLFFDIACSAPHT